MKLTIVPPSARPSMPAVVDAVARNAEGTTLRVAACDLALVVTEVMPSITGAISEDQAARLRAALARLRAA